MDITAGVQIGLTMLIAILQLTWFFGKRAATADVSHADLVEDFARLNTTVGSLQHELQSIIGRIEMLSTQVADARVSLELVRTRTHELNNRLSALPHELSQSLVPRDLADVVARESVEDRRRLHDELDTVWVEIQKLRDRTA